MPHKHKWRCTGFVIQRSWFDSDVRLHIRKFLLVLALLFTPIVEASTYITVGNGIGFRSDVGKFQVFLTVPYDKKVLQTLGVTYPIWKNKDTEVRIGGGFATTIHDFNAIDGFLPIYDKEVTPMFQIEGRKGPIVLQLYYTNPEYTVARYKLIGEGPPKVYEERKDSFKNPIWKVFIGYRFTFK